MVETDTFVTCPHCKDKQRWDSVQKVWICQCTLWRMEAHKTPEGVTVEAISGKHRTFCPMPEEKFKGEWIKTPQ